MDCIVPVELVSPGAYLLPASICAVALVAVAISAFRRRHQLRSSGRIVLGLSFLIIIATFGSILYQSTSAKIAIEGTQIAARAFFVSASAPLDSVVWDGVADASSKRFPVRTSGTSFSGVQIGWFRTSEGRSTFVLRSKQPSVLVPTRGGFDFVLSKAALDQLLQCKAP